MFLSGIWNVNLAFVTKQHSSNIDSGDWLNNVNSRRPVPESPHHNPHTQWCCRCIPAGKKMTTMQDPVTQQHPRLPKKLYCTGLWKEEITEKMYFIISFTCSHIPTVTSGNGNCEPRCHKIRRNAEWMLCFKLCEDEIWCVASECYITRSPIFLMWKKKRGYLFFFAMVNLKQPGQRQEHVFFLISCTSIHHH